MLREKLIIYQGKLDPERFRLAAQNTLVYFENSRPRGVVAWSIPYLANFLNNALFSKILNK
jgi:hypothetical protein